MDMREREDDQVVKEDLEIEEELISYFNSFYALLLLKGISLRDWIELEKSFSLDEVKNEVFGFNRNKSPSPYGSL